MPASGHTMRVARSIIIGTILFSVAFAQAALPPLPAPPMPVTQEQRDGDVKAFRRWWYSFINPPEIAAVCRLKAWSDEHPQDGEEESFNRDLGLQEDGAGDVEE